MPLEEGKRLGQYEIQAPLGAGGMGEVYRARDTKLGRDVAVKVLPEHFAEDKERMARFEREARVLASLNHPNIAAVYGLEEAEGSHFLVMELVPGESLAAKIQRGPVSVDEAIRIVRQLIDALEAAHESGVVHRDLKPANVQLTPDGHIKVLDFGLAKVEVGEASSSDLSLSPTMTRDATQAGIILGTASYMSPEQARGLPVDKRSDIFSFGCVLFEMLTGRKAFQGDLVSDVMASVIKSEPSWSLLPSSAGGFRRLLERCLEKEPKQRLRDIGDARVELADGTRAPAERSGGVTRVQAAALAAACLAVGAVAAGALMTRSSPSPTRASGAIRTRVETPKYETTGTIAVSPDGRAFAHSYGQGGLYLRRLDSWETSTLVEGQTQSAGRVFFSHDGEWLGFFSQDDGGVYKIGISNGALSRLADAPASWTGGSWTENGTILVSAERGLWEVDENGGALRPLLALPEDEGAEAPNALPGGAGVLFQHVVSAREESVAVYDLRSNELRTLVPGGIRPRYLDSGHIVYVSGATIMAAPFDLASLALAGDAVPLIERVRVRDSRMLNVASSIATYDVSRSGTLVYFSDIEAGAGRRLVRVDPSLPAEARVTVLGDNRVSRDVRASPDGTRIAAQNQGGDNDIWIYDLERATMTRLTFDPGEDETAVWSPDGRDIVYAGQPPRRTIFRARADGSAPPEILWESEQHAHVHDWSPDGRWLVLDVDAGPNFDVWILDVESGEARPLLDSRFDELLPRLSPDGRFLAYVSNESGRQEIYVQRFPDLGDKRQVSNEGGHHPIWSRDGRNLFYRTATHVMTVDVRVEDAIELSPPVALFEDTFHTVIGSHGTYDVLPDGSFVMLESESTQAENYLNVVVNWIDEVMERVPR